MSGQTPRRTRCDCLNGHDHNRRAGRSSQRHTRGGAVSIPASGPPRTRMRSEEASPKAVTSALWRPRGKGSGACRGTRVDTPCRSAVVGVAGRRAARVDRRRRRFGVGNEEQRGQLRRGQLRRGQGQGPPVTELARRLRRGGNDRHAGHRRPGTDRQPVEPVVRRRRDGPTSRHPGRRVIENCRPVSSRAFAAEDRLCRR